MSLLHASATFSADGLYRYQLWRLWDPSDRSICFIMLNPSIASAERDDPTLRRCVGFARRWGAGSVAIVNLFARVATYPVELARCPDPVGPANDEVIVRAITGRTVICAWGNFGGSAWMPERFRDRDLQVLRLLEQTKTPLRCLGLTKAGFPSHPLHLPNGRKPRDFTGRTP